ncbi:hypothetical protein DSM104443_03945 [Usitatibacter rugosus]|uniref:Uncharacterized protein n=1 Tax=Usitatibacter rugosus TaxID=2732067 RepID=A0A6M4H012_9PROT|nr:hypothetical protein DSM104443_03945 [Usitatibacter rugosus]
MVKPSSSSNALSSITGMFENGVPTEIVFGAPSPAAQDSVPVICAGLPTIPKSCPAIAFKLAVVQVTLIAPAVDPTRFTVTAIAAVPSTYW